MNLKREVSLHYKANGREVPGEQEVIRYACDNLTIPCFEDGRVYRNRFTDAPTYAQRGKKSPDWGFMLNPLKLLAKEGDRGMGDIIERTIGPVGGEAYRRWWVKIFGKPCGCKERQESLNIEFPL